VVGLFGARPKTFPFSAGSKRSKAPFSALP